MKPNQRLWTRDELILAMGLYLKTEFGKIHGRNPDIIELANLIDRTPGSVSYKLVNLASLDPSIRESGRRGAVNASKLDREIWDEYFENWDDLPYESEKLKAKLLNTSIEKTTGIETSDLPQKGIERERMVKTRVNQWLFREGILAANNHQCCITGLNIPGLLVAGHISRWADDEKNRLNLRNGLLLNTLHDKAFENGLITITPNYIVQVSPKLLKSKNKNGLHLFEQYNNQPIILPQKFLPDPELLRIHNENSFIK